MLRFNKKMLLDVRKSAKKLRFGILWLLATFPHTYPQPLIGFLCLLQNEF